MSSPWSHLPNAVYIDRIIESLRANPDEWSRAAARWVWYGGWRQARDQAHDRARPKEATAVWHTTRVVQDMREVYSADARDAAEGAIDALIAWDNCSHLLDTDPKHVKMIALLGQPAAILLYPACRVLHTSKTV